MENTPQVGSFVTFIKQKNGSYKFYQSITQKANIYRWLVEQGYGRCSLDNKIIVFKKTGNDIEPSSVQDMKDAFHDYLKNIPSEELPKGLNRNNLRNWSYSTSPLKQNNLFRHYLTVSLSDSEIHQYKLKSDAIYAHRYRISLTLDMLNAKGFKHARDLAASSKKNNILYYKLIDANQYLLFIHHNPDLKSNDCFEYCLASYDKESNIGRVKNPAAVNCSNSFYIERDLPLIEQYFTVSA